MDLAQAITALASAIALAEGYTQRGSLPWRACNPGDLEEGDLGNGTLNSKTIYPDHSSGWAALEFQCGRILTGSSTHYKPTMTVPQIAAIYTGNDNPAGWAATVCDALGLLPTDPLSKILS